MTNLKLSMVISDGKVEVLLIILSLLLLSLIDSLYSIDHGGEAISRIISEVEHVCRVQRNMYSD